jgi:hypothetical protein
MRRNDRLRLDNRSSWISDVDEIQRKHSFLPHLVRNFAPSRMPVGDRRGRRSVDENMMAFLPRLVRVAVACWRGFNVNVGWGSVEAIAAGERLAELEVVGSGHGERERQMVAEGNCACEPRLPSQASSIRAFLSILTFAQSDYIERDEDE